MTTTEIDRLEEMKVPELQAKFAEVVGESTRSPNKTYLVRRIREAIAAAAQTSDAEVPGTDGQVGHEGEAGTTEVQVSDPLAEALAGATDPAGSETPAQTVKLAKFDVPALQALYREVIGRDTASESRNYLVWKIREGQKGRVPLGPRARGRRAGEKVMVLPLRMGSSLVDRLDEVWPRLGLHSRMDLFRSALRAYFESIGERDLADLLAPDA